MLRLTKSLGGVLLLTTLLVVGCKTKYRPAADAGLDGGGPENTAAACQDGIDNDEDGDTDCADSECVDLAVCIESDCSNGIDDDGDGFADCLDTDCQSTIDCRENTSVACNDGIDNDGDGDTDCLDSDCDGMFVCNFESICDDSLDNDNDTLVDCDDPDCDGAVNCGGFCYNIDYQAPVAGIAITEANHDLDPNTACVQYDVVVQATSPEPNTQVCLYIDDLNSAAIGCADPNTQNPMTFRVTLCAGDHTLYARVEQGTEVCDQLNVGLEQIAVTVYEDPSCTITLPAGLSTDSANPTCWTQATMDVEVTSNGADAQLWVAGALLSQQNITGGVATFTAASMGADGDKMIRALCDNPGIGNGDTWSPDYYITQDTEAPTPQILSPASGVSFGAGDCPFTMTVTNVEAGLEVCANYNGQTPHANGCATSTGTGQQIDLTVDCANGVALPVEAYATDSCNNRGADSILVTSDTGIPTVLIESPANGQLYNKSADTINASTDDFELDIVACTDGDYNPALITLTVDSLNITSITPTVVAANCLGLSHRITWSSAYAFMQSASGLQTPHTVVVEVSDGFNTGNATSTFSNDTIAPILSFNCFWCRPNQEFFTSADDNCSTTPEFEVQTLVEVSGIEVGQQVTLDVTNAGSPVGNSPYQMLATQSPVDLPDFETPCGVELATGQNNLTASVTDAAGNAAVPAVKAVTYGSGLVVTPTDDQVLSTADDCDPGADYGISVQVQVDHASVPNGTPIEVSVSSGGGGWAYPAAGTDVWNKNCSGDPCNFTFCVSVPAGTVQQSDIAVDMIVSSTTVPGGPRGIIVDLSPPDPATSPARVVTNRRAAEVQLSWNSVEDNESGILQQWDVRCVEDGTISLANWASAMQYSGEPTPATDTTPQTMLISEDTNASKIRAGHSYSCAIRGQSVVGLWSGLAVFADIAVADLAFVEHSYVIEGYTDQFDEWYFPSVAAAGDVNRDGFDDVLVGFGKTGEGKASAIYFGSATGVSATGRLLLTCADSSFGSALVGVGNFDGDTGNYPDFAVAAEDEGRVYVFFGASGLAGLGTLDCASADVVIQGPIGTRFGNAVVPAGDFDGDGRRDIAIGAYSHGGDQGAVYIVFGRDEPSYPVTINFNNGANTDGSIALTRTVDNRAGKTLAAADLDKDGRWDLVIGAPWRGTSGGIEVLLGYPVTKTPDAITTLTDADLDQTIDLNSLSTYWPSLAVSALTVSDIDGDGCTDVLVGAQWGDQISSGEAVGDVHVYRGVKVAANCTGALETAPAFTVYGTGDWDQFGLAVGKRMNLTADPPVPWKINGVMSSPSDEAIFAGAAQHSLITSASTGPGYAAFFWGPVGSSMDITQADVLFAAPSGAAGFGWTSFVGDLNGDGYVDLAVGDLDFATAGRIHIYY